MSVAALLFRPKRCRGGEARVHSTRLPRTNTTTAPPPPSTTTTEQLAGQQAGERRSKRRRPIPRSFLPRRGRLRPARMVSGPSPLPPPPAAGSALLFVAAVCARYLSVLLIISVRDLDLCRVGVREELARFDLRRSCSFTSYSSGTLSVLASQWQDVSHLRLA